MWRSDLVHEIPSDAICYLKRPNNGKSEDKSLIFSLNKNKKEKR